MPVARVACPLPSILTERAICVSVVLRSAVAARVGIAVSFSAIAYTKSALGESFRKRGKTSPILFRSPDGETNAAVEERHASVKVLDQHAAALHAFEYGCGVRDTNQDEIRVAWKNRDARQLAQLAVETPALRVDAARLRFEHVIVREDALGDQVGQHVDVVGGADLVEFADPPRPPYGVAEPDAGEPELRQSAHDHEIRELRQPRHEGLAREWVVGLVDHHQSRGSADDLRNGLIRE